MAAPVFGIMLGGIVTKRWQPSARVITVYGVFINLVTIAGWVVAIFYLGCPKLDIAGVPMENGL